MKMPDVIKTPKELMASVKYDLDDLDEKIQHLRSSGMGGEYRQEVEMYEKILKEIASATVNVAGVVPELIAGEEYER